MKKSLLTLGSIALACTLLSACNEEEELVPKMEPAKPEVRAQKPEEQPEAAEQAKVEEPELVPIQSLSDDSDSQDDAAPAMVPAPSGSVQPLSSGDFVIQVSIQSSKKAADGIVRKLAESGIKAYIAEVENPGELEGTYYRIRVGYFESSANAQEYGKQVLSPLNYAWWVDMSKNDDVGNPGDDYDSYSDNYQDSYAEPEPAPEPEP